MCLLRVLCSFPFGRHPALVLLCLLAPPALSAAGASAPAAGFDWFEYTGRDEVFEGPLGPHEYRNPVLAGFYPDPSICRVADDYYLVNSSFCWWPGIPVFHSRDLVHWRQLGHVIERPSQASFDGLGISRGVFAPAISHHDGIFYLVTTLVDAGGNCFFTATDPAGPWSDPVWLSEVDGIDPSFFFDDDGSAWLVNNGPPPEDKPLYSGHRAIWLQQFDVATQRLTGPREIIVNAGVDLAREPIWIEGPHLYRRAGWYFLICAEGGTGENHSEVIFRSRHVRGPYEPWAGNPILTQRDLDSARAHPVTSTGHADMVDLPNGEWWAVFLGCRPYDAAARHYNTGRETFMLPVSWSNDGWPVILGRGEAVPYKLPAPRVERVGPGAPNGPAIPLTGNFTWLEDFDRPTLSPIWNQLRGPAKEWIDPARNPGLLTLVAQPDGLDGTGRPSFVGRRVQHARFTATAELRLPAGNGVSAGLAAFQNETHHFYLGVRRTAAGAEAFLERADGGAPVVVAAGGSAGGTQSIRLRIEVDDERIAFFFSPGSDGWTELGTTETATVLSTATAGGFVGSYVGLHARLESR